MKKILVLSTIVLSAVLLLAGCFSFSTGALNTQKSIYTDDAAIAAQGDSYNASYSWSQSGSQSAMEYSTFTGSMTRYLLFANGEGQVKFEYDATVSKGKFKLVVISEDGQVTTVFEGTDKGTKTIDIPGGKNLLKLVGDEASGRFQFNLSISDNVSVESVKK